MEKVYSWYNSAITLIYFLSKDTYKEVFVLNVGYIFNCSWDSQKKERISNLISERILLLTGIRIFEKIDSITFCEKEWIKDQLSENSCSLSNERAVALQISEASYKKKYKLLFEKDILFSMLTPGEGQSYFDNLIIKLKNTIQEN
jgi:hypothetical protein